MKIRMVVLVFGMLLAACTSPRQASQDAPVENDETVVFSVLAGDWALESLKGEKVPAEALVTMNLSDSGRFSGSGGCNRYFGAFTLTEGKLGIGPIGSTMMACEQAAMDLERSYLDALGIVTRITRDDNILYLADEQGRQLLSLRAVPPGD